MFRVPKRLENIFGKKLFNIFQRLINRVAKGKQPVEEVMREFVFSKQADEYVEKAVADMVNAQRIGSAKSWRESADRQRALQKEIYSYIQNEMKGTVGVRVSQMISENSLYIKTLPQEWAEYATKYAFRESQKGRRPEEIEAELRKVIPEHMQKNLKTIARTECAKANAAIAQARAEDLGISCYIWRTCHDERVRPSHRRMDGVVCFWDNPPSPEGQGAYHPGNIYNCRCFAEPVLDIRDLPKNSRVWSDGNIRRLSKKAVMKMDRYTRQ